MSEPKSLPIACTLSANDLRARLESINELSREALRRHVRGDLQLDLFYDPASAERVRAMVTAEQHCCAFLEFNIREEPDSLHVTVVAPERARAAADELFDQFLPSTEASR